MIKDPALSDGVQDLNFSSLSTKIVPYLTKKLNFMKFFRHLQHSTRFYSILC